nr:BrnA antitoxin family protein [Pseudomonas piscis]
MDEAFFRQAELYLPGKKAVPLLPDAPVLGWLKSQGAGY